jgi:hypothetical protein
MTVVRTRPLRMDSNYSQHVTNSVAQEPEGSSPHSQQPTTGPCPETVDRTALTRQEA